MSQRRIAWQEGEARVQSLVENWMETGAAEAGPITSARLSESSRRVVHRIDSPDELAVDPEGNPAVRALVVKIHLTHSGPHKQRETLKRKVGYSPALREWQALGDLHAARVPVPEPLAWGTLPSGDPLLVTEYFAGRDLTSVLSESALPDQLAWIDRLASSVRLLQAAGFRHGDLHLGNLYARADQVMVLDLQRARRARNRGEQLRDLAHLDFSMARLGFDLDLRIRLRKHFDAQPDLDRASRRFVRDFMRGRSRRDFRIGRAWERWPRDTHQSGVRLRGLRDSTTAVLPLHRALEADRSDPRPGDRRGGETRISRHDVETRSLVLKRVTSTSRRRKLTNRLFGSAASSGFRNGQRLALLGPLGARALAAVEEETQGGAHSSWLVLESVGRCDLDEFRPSSEAEAKRCAIALARWIAEWHAWGIDHRDLKASNIRFDDAGGRFRFWLIDLEDIRFRRRPNDRSRLRALVQLNASLEDGILLGAARKAGLHAYLDRLPFKRRPRHMLIESIVKQSLAREHRWQGLGCEAAERPSS